MKNVTRSMFVKLLYNRLLGIIHIYFTSFNCTTFPVEDSSCHISVPASTWMTLPRIHIQYHMVPPCPPVLVRVNQHVALT